MKAHIKGISGLLMFLVLVLTASIFASAVEVDTRANQTYTRSDVEDAINQGSLVQMDVLSVKINGDVVENGDTIRTNIERDGDLRIDVKLLAHGDVSDVEVISMINGDDHYEISDTTDTFDAEKDVIYTKSLSLSLSYLLEKDNYNLRVIVASRNDAVKVYNYLLKIDAQKHSVMIKDVIFTPDSEVVAGRSLLGVVRVKNIGKQDEEGIRVKISIPELAVSATDYIDELEAEDSVSSEELYMRIPCDANGDYTARVTVDYDEGFKQVSRDYTISVTESDACGGAIVTPTSDVTKVTVDSTTKDVKIGAAGAVYPITLTNQGTSSKTYTIEVVGTDDWAQATISPTHLVVLGKGETQTVYVYVSAKDSASSGSHMFSINIKIGSEVVKQIPLTANIVGKASAGLGAKVWLEIALIILVVILVIIGLVIGFSRMKGKEEEPEEPATGQTYY